MKKQIEISLEQARKIWKEENEVINRILLTQFTEEKLTNPILPESWEDMEDKNPVLRSLPHWIIRASKEYRAMYKLAQLMKVYNGGSQEDWCDWSDENQYKYVIHFIPDQFSKKWSYTCRYFLAFKTEELRDHFLEHHRELIQQANRNTCNPFDEFISFHRSELLQSYKFNCKNS